MACNSLSEYILKLCSGVTDASWTFALFNFSSITDLSTVSERVSASCKVIDYTSLLLAGLSMYSLGPLTYFVVFLFKFCLRSFRARAYGLCIIWHECTRRISVEPFIRTIMSRFHLSLSVLWHLQLRTLFVNTSNQQRDTERSTLISGLVFISSHENRGFCDVTYHNCILSVCTFTKP